MTRVVRLAFVGVVTSLILTGCSGDPEPRFEPPPSTTPTTSEPTEEPEPESYEVRSKEGAVAFARHWVDVFNAAVSGDTAELVESSDPHCATCNGFLDRIRSVYDAGGSYQAFDWRVLVTSITPRQSLERPELVVRILRGAERYRESSKAEVELSPASRSTYRVELLWGEGGWRMARMVRFT